MIITLAWNGPVGIGNFPTDSNVLEALDAPGVYLRLKSYERGRGVSYVGQSKSLLTRIDQHITALLSLQYPTRDATGAPVTRGDFADRIRAYNDLEAAMEATIADAARMRFFLAPCDDDLGFSPDHLNLVEGAIKTRLETHAVAGADACENIQGVPGSGFDGIVAIESDFTGLASADATTIAELIGAEPLAIPEAALGLGHAE